MKRIDDVSDWAIWRCHGTFRYLYHLQAAVDDLVGAAKALQWDVAAYALREATLLAISIRKMPQRSDIVPDVGDGFSGLLCAYDPTGEPGLEALYAAVNRAAASPTADSVEAAFSLLDQYVRETESMLGYSHEIPELRSARGTSMLLRLFREGDQFAQSLGLPSAVPPDWATKESE
ncbi:hypothetical protein OOT46_02755 [Aquabacterium sp. A7-Y]|uniref:hypothetical protein n=1 Tax=Aquabacterium sp. A7-Y TaxID=1349605 RepID=UPI00223DAD78|nr:hypothetical protein [Aquabacterium sp. A7-Y]MCW7536773.1 hypothetical protein [Aquabacterium sp. A7-Y]